MTKIALLVSVAVCVTVLFRSHPLLISGLLLLLMAMRLGIF